MKKIFVFILLMVSLSMVKAEEQINVRLEWVPNVYYNYEKDGLNYWGQFAFIYANDKIAYCLDISKNINSTIYGKTNEVQTNDLVVLAGYFGYNYEGNSTLKDYMATQQLIWEYLGTPVYFTTESHGKGKRIDIDDNALRIVYKINNHAYFPLYDSNYRFIIGSENNLIQTNKQINEYNILNNTNNVIDFNERGIMFKANEIGNNYFYLQTKYNKNFDNQIYVAEDSQKIMVIGGIENISRMYSYNVIGGSIHINVGADDGIFIKNVTENEFSLYLDNELVGIYKPDNNGKIIINNLNLGSYKLIHNVLCEGYKSSNEEYDIDVTIENLDKKLNINLQKKTLLVTINKSYGNPILNTLYYDENVKYSIYDGNGNLIDEVVTNDNGNVEFNLDYGDYRIVQSSISKINKFHEDIIISKDQFDNVLNYKIYDEYFNSKIKFIFLDKDTKLPITNIKFNFEGNEYNTDQYNFYISTSLQEGSYKIKDISLDGYNNISEEQFELDKSSEFYIVDGEVFVDKIIYMEKKQEIKDVKDDSIIEEIKGNVTLDNTDIKEDDIDDENQEENIIIDKLPFLGDKTNVGKKYKIFNFVYCNYHFFGM